MASVNPVSETKVNSLLWPSWRSTVSQVLNNRSNGRWDPHRAGFFGAKGGTRYRSGSAHPALLFDLFTPLTFVAIAAHPVLQPPAEFTQGVEHGA